MKLGYLILGIIFALLTISCVGDALRDLFSFRIVGFVVDILLTYLFYVLTKKSFNNI